MTLLWSLLNALGIQYGLFLFTGLSPRSVLAEEIIQFIVIQTVVLILIQPTMQRLLFRQEVLVFRPKVILEAPL